MEEGKKISQRKGGLAGAITGNQGTQQTQGSTGLTQQQENLKEWTKGKLQEKGILQNPNQTTTSTPTLPGINATTYEFPKKGSNIKSNLSLPGIDNSKYPNATLSAPTKEQIEESIKTAKKNGNYKKSWNEIIEDEMYKDERMKQIKYGLKQGWGDVKKAMFGAVNNQITSSMEQAKMNYQADNELFGKDVSEEVKDYEKKIEEVKAGRDEYIAEVNQKLAEWKDKNMNKILEQKYNDKSILQMIKDKDRNNLGYGTINAFSTSILPMLPSLTLGVITKNPTVATATAFSSTYVIEKEEAYEEAREAGATREEADLIGTAVGSVNGILESYGFDKMFGGFLKNLTKNTVKDFVKKGGRQILWGGAKEYIKGMGSEGLTEALQEFWKNLMIYTIDPDKNIWEGVGESGFYGAILGGGFSTTSSVSSVVKDIDTNNKIDQITDIEALNYVLESEKRKQQQDKIKQKILNRRGARSWEDVETRDTQIENIPEMDNGYTPTPEEAEQWKKEDEERRQYEQELEDEYNRESQIEQDMINDVLDEGDLNEDLGDPRYQKSDSPQSVSKDTVSEKSHAGNITITPENSSEINQNLNGIKRNIRSLNPETFLQKLKNSFTGAEGSNYIKVKIDGKNYVLRISNHHTNANTSLKHPQRNTSIVIKLMKKGDDGKTIKFKKNNKVNLAEFVYDPANLDSDKMRGIIDGIQNWMQTGEYTDTNYDSKNESTRKKGDNKKSNKSETGEKHQLKYEDKDYTPGVANKNEKDISGKEGLKQKNKINDETIEELARKYGVKTEVIKGMIEILRKGKRDGYAYGKYKNQLLTLSEQIKESTAPHELLHAIFDMIDPETKVYLISQVMKSEGWNAETAEERLADSFSNFFRTGKIEGAPKSTWGRIKIFFKRVRSFINGMNKWRNELDDIFTNIITADGIEDLQGRIDENKSLEKSKEKMRKRFMEYRKNAQKMESKRTPKNWSKKDASYQIADESVYELQPLERIEKMEQNILDEYGETDNPSRVAFVDNKGRWINGNMGGYGNYRDVDHREIAQTAFDDTDIEFNTGTDGLVALQAQTGLVRVNYNDGYMNIDTVYELMPSQREGLMKFADENIEEVNVDITDQKTGRTVKSETFMNVRDAIRFIDRHFSENGNKFQKAGDINSQAFKKRFGNSKIVNEDGTPKIMYHGTPTRFTVFDKNKIGENTGNYGYSGDGFYFTDSRSYAGGYGNNVMEVYLKVEKPFTFTKENIKKYSKYLEGVEQGHVSLDKNWVLSELKKNDEKSYDFAMKRLENPDNAWKTTPYPYDMKYDPNNIVDLLRETERDGRGYEFESVQLDYFEGFGKPKYKDDVYYYPSDPAYMMGLGEYSNQEFVDAIRKDGFDGIITFGEVVVFESNQVKSATDNVGTYDENNDDIRYQKMDDEYTEAVENGNTTRAKSILREYAKEKGYNSSTDYQGSLAFNGSAPASNGFTKEERVSGNEDIYSQTLGDFASDGLDWWDLGRQLDPNGGLGIARSRASRGVAGGVYDLESINNLRNAVMEYKKGNKDVKIRMYRAIDSDIKEEKFRNGDWITPSKEYAKHHIDLQDWKKGRVISEDVSIEDIRWDGNDINERGFDNEKEYGYKDTPNNRKELEITYDDNGNLIPLSERFNENVEDERYQKAEDKLINLHNLSMENLRKSKRLGGFPMPSIAITKEGVPHTSYGDISVIFKKDTVDPSKNKANKLFGVDAYTPTVPRIVAIPKNTKEADKIIDKIQDETGLSYGEVLQWIEYKEDYERYYPELLKYSDLHDKVADYKIFDGYTPAGKRRYLDYNLENLVKKMKKTDTLGAFGNFGNLVGAEKGKVKSIEDIRAMNFAPTNLEEYRELSKEYSDNLREFYNNVIKGDSPLGYDMFSRLVESTYNKDDNKRLNKLNEEVFDQFLKRRITLDDVKKIHDPIKRGAEMVRPYAEAKPERAVGFDEVGAIVVPNEQLEEARELMKDTGVDVYGYAEGERMNVIDAVADDNGLKFQKAGDTKSANFKKRFDGSKVVKENGKPQIVYHGTTAEFTVFNKIASRGIFGDGYYFTNRIGTARQYGYGRDGRVMKVYLAIKNPYVADNGDGYFLNTEKLKEEGYDGVQAIMGSETYWVAFDSNQIKSATDNVGTYDINNDDIRYQKAEYEYDEDGNRKRLKFGEEKEFDPSIFGTPTKEEQIEEDKENEKSNPFYNAWIKYNNQNYKDDQLTLGEFVDAVGAWGDKKQEEFNEKQNDILEAENDPKMLELQLRAVKLMEEEGNVGKKFGKNVSKEVRDRQQAEVEKKREDLAKDIYEWMYPGLSFEESTYEDQSSAWDKEAEWEMLGREKIEEKLRYFKKDSNGNWEKKNIKLETPQEQREKIEKSGNFDEVIEPKDRVIQWETPEGQKGRLDKAKDPRQFKKVMEKINSGKSKTKVELKDVTNEVRALERYKENEKAEKERRKKEKQEEYAKKKQEEYKRNVRLKAFQRLVDMQRFEKFTFLTEDEIKQRWGFTDEEWKKITEQLDLGYPPKKRNEKAVSDFNKAVDSEVKFIIEGLTRQNNMKRKDAEKNLGEIGEIDLDVLLGKDEEKGQKEVEEFERIAEEEKKKSKKEKNKRLEQAREDVTNVEIDKERENSKSEKERVDKLIKSTKSDKTVWGSVKQFTSNILTPVSTKIKNISPKIYREVMRYFQNKDILTNKRLKEVDPFLKTMGKIRKENPVRFMDIRVALANRNIGYANGLLKEYGVKVPTKLLDTIFDEAEDVGLNINYLGSYYPLSVKAPKSFLEELMKVGKGDIASEIEKKIQQESQKKGGPLDESEITAIINEVIAGEDKGPDVNTGNKHLKKRNTEIERTPKMLEYCDDPISTLISYIEGMTQSIERAKFLGKSRSGNVHTLADYVYNAKNNLSPEQQDELMDLLKALFNDESPNKFVQTWRDLGTLTTLGSPSSTLTQLGDLSFSVYENGRRETLKAIRDIRCKRKAFDLQEMGVLNRGEEYTNINSQKNLLQKAIHNVFKLTFFSTFDTFGKSTFIQSTRRKRQKRAKVGENGDPQLIKDIMKITDDEYTTIKIINDLRNGVFSEEVALVMYMKLGNIQPLTKAQMPKAYLNNPNGRLFYQFKTFGIKQLDYVLQEAKEQTKDFKKLSTTDKFLKIAQIANMVFIMTLLGVGADELKDLTMRRKSNSLILRRLYGEDVGTEQVWEKMEDNVLKLFGLSRYTIMQMKSDPVDAITSLFTTLPATNIVNYPFKDIYKAFKNDGSINWSNPSSYQLIPVIGKYWYWIYGGGQEKQQEALDKEHKKNTTSGGSSRSTRNTRSRNTRSRNTRNSR